MYIEQLYTGCLSEAAYYIESDGKAAVIDPIRESKPYLSLAEDRNAKIEYIFETHFHADFVSGHLDLAKKTGATIVYGPNANPGYTVHVARDGETFQLGKLTFEVIHTPGHTLESTCYLLKDENGRPHALFSGDTLFVNAVGRPDLAVKSERPLSKEDLADMMYDSLRNKILPLADDILVYPAHGAGSSCGKGIGKETWSTIGQQKEKNYALQEMTREAFIKEVTEGLQPPPAYFFEDARINMEGYDELESVLNRNLNALSAEDFKQAMGQDTLILDTRSPDQFSAGFIPGSINIGLNGSFAIWVGTLLSINTRLLLVTEPGKEQESIIRLARVGYEQVEGFLEGGIDSWSEKGQPIANIRNIEPEALPQARLEMNNSVLDVRKPSEFATKHVSGATNLPLSLIDDHHQQLNQDTHYLIHCAGGYRSMIAASMLAAKGYHNITNVRGGMGKIKHLDIPLETEVVPA